jgi:uncharacterized protein YaiL (DUF2058 family)
MKISQQQEQTADPKAKGNRIKYFKKMKYLNNCPAEIITISKMINLDFEEHIKTR